MIHGQWWHWIFGNFRRFRFSSVSSATLNHRSSSSVRIGANLVNIIGSSFRMSSLFNVHYVCYDSRPEYQCQSSSTVDHETAVTLYFPNFIFSICWRIVDCLHRLKFEELFNFWSRKKNRIENFIRFDELLYSFFPLFRLCFFFFFLLV